MYVHNKQLNARASDKVSARVAMITVVVVAAEIVVEVVVVDAVAVTNAIWMEERKKECAPISNCVVSLCRSIPLETILTLLTRGKAARTTGTWLCRYPKQYRLF